MHTRLTKIVCTIGPTSDTPKRIAALAKTGMSIARLNLSHGTHQDHVRVLEILRTINEKLPVPIGILLDTKGGEIRTGKRQQPLEVHKGEEVVFYPPSMSSPPSERGNCIEVSYDNFYVDVKETDTILIDNGELAFDIVSVHDDGTVIARARNDGSVGDCRHINLPGANIDNPTITDNDWSDIDFAIEQDVDFLALSFIRTARDIIGVREYIQTKGGTMELIGKIETRQAISHMQEIIQEADGVMIARGDLGAEIPFEQLPAIQDDITARCNDAGKPVIIATHMLESMREYSIPTRAEMTDVAHAAVTYADATMLSGETASGKHPDLSLQAMHRLLVTAEEYTHGRGIPPHLHIRGEYDIRAKAAVQLAHETSSAVLIVFTRTGATAKQLSRYRPAVPIVACTNSPVVQRKLSLLYGVSSLLIEFADAQTTIVRGIETAKKNGFIHEGEKLIVVSDVPKDVADWSIQQRVL